MLAGNVEEIPNRLLFPGWVHTWQQPHDQPCAANYYRADLRTTDWDLDNNDRRGEFSGDNFDWEIWHRGVVS